MALLKVSCTVSTVTAAVLVFGGLIDKRYSIYWRYFVWLALAIRLLVPFDINWYSAPVVIQTKQHAVVLRTHGSVPVALQEKRDTAAQGGAAAGEDSAESADYAPIVDLRDLLKIVWACGAVIALGVPVMQYFVFRARAGCRRTACKFTKTPVYFCQDVETPILIGFFKPRILLPVKEYAEEELEMIILHEDAHKRRGDLWYKLILLLARSVHWFNPAVWVMVRTAQRDLEYSCDFAVCGKRDMEFRKKYSRTILKSVKKEEGI